MVAAASNPLVDPRVGAPPGFADVEAAAARLAGHAVRTPLIESVLLNERLGGRLLVKAEMLQRSGSFKFRGAFNRLSMIPPAERARGVVAFSSGNHAQGVALAAKLLRIPAWIVMPADAPRSKIANTRAYGADVVLYDRWGESREQIGERLAREKGATLVRPYDDPGVIAGQGTIGLEIAAQAAELGIRIDTVLAPCSGGGLVSGIALGLSGRSPSTKIYSVEPAALDDMKRSLADGTRVANAPDARSICDALLAAMPGEITFALARRLLAGGIAVSDDDAREAMAAVFEFFKVVVEPSGAVGLASVLTGRVEIGGKCVVAVCSGGNVEAATYLTALGHSPEV